MEEALHNDGVILFVDAETGAECFQVNLDSTAELDAGTEETLVKNEETSNLSDHYTLEGDKYKCSQCTRYTSNCEEKMKRHIRKVHQGLNPYKCSLCEYSTYNSVLFQEHVWIHEGVKPYECSYCKYRSVSKKNLKKHELIHGPNYPLRCKKCKYIARHNRALKCHMQETHGTLQEMKQQEKPDSKNIQCQYCDVTFKTYSALTNHRKCRKRCSVCEKVLCKSDFNKHMSEHGVSNTETGRKVKRYVFTCEICKWMGSSKPKILLHLIHHPNQDLSDCKVDLTVLRECGILPVV